MILVHHLRIGRSIFTVWLLEELGLEYELAFRTAEDVTAAVSSAEQISELVDQVRPAFELIEDKEADYSDICPLTLIADNAWCGGVVLGDPLDGWQDMDLSNTGSILEQDGVPAEEGNTGSANPWASFVWVLNHFAERGDIVRKGEWIITGSVLKTRFPAAGDRLQYTVGGAASVQVAIT